MSKRLVLVLLIVVLLAALLLPAAARAGDRLFLPYAAAPAPRDWFTQQEFEGALAAAGYVPVLVTPFTWCELADEAAPPAWVVYAVCHLDLTPGDPSDAVEVIFWWDGAGGRVVWAMVAQ